MSDPEATSAPPRDRAPTQRLLALAGLAVGAVLALVAGSRGWWRAAGTGVSVSFTGTEATGGLAQALALVVLAGALLGLVLRARGRRVLGVLLALAGAGVVVLGAVRPRPASGTVQSRVLEVSLADQFALLGTAWPYVYALSGLLVLAGALLMSATAPRWPSRTARFERPGTARPAVPGPADGPLGDDDPASLWKLMDAGVDPTAAAEPTHEGESEPADGPVVAGPTQHLDDPDGRDEAHTVQPLDAADLNHETSPVGPRAPAEAAAHPSDGGDVHEQPSGVTMNPRATARTDEPT